MPISSKYHPSMMLTAGTRLVLSLLETRRTPVLRPEPTSPTPDWTSHSGDALCLVLGGDSGTPVRFP